MAPVGHSRTALSTFARRACSGVSFNTCSWPSSPISKTSGAASTHVLIDPKEDLVAIYCTQLIEYPFALRAEFVTLLYQSIVGN